METVVVDRTQARDEQGPAGETGGEFLGPEQRGERELLPLHIKSVRRVDVGIGQVSAVGGEHRRVGVRHDGAGAGAQSAIEKLVEGAVGGGGLGELVRVEIVVHHEGQHLVDAGGPVHSPAIPSGEPGPADDGGEAEATEGIAAVDEAQPGLAVDAFAFDAAGAAVEEFDRFVGHGGTRRPGNAATKSKNPRVLEDTRVGGGFSPA